MPEPLFPRWTNAIASASLIALGALLVGAPAAGMAWVRSTWVTGEDLQWEQPVRFDHRHHVRDDGIDCLYCHTSADRSASAGFPPTGTCMGCHNQIWTDSPLLADVRHSAFTGEPLRWRRVYDLPDFVYFDHGIHVGRGVGCESCHGRVDLMANVVQAGTTSMGWCLGCHRDPTGHIRPRDAVTEMGWEPAYPGQQRELVDLLGIRPTTDCSGCHR